MHIGRKQKYANSVVDKGKEILSLPNQLKNQNQPKHKEPTQLLPNDFLTTTTLQIQTIIYRFLKSGKDTSGLNHTNTDTRTVSFRRQTSDFLVSSLIFKHRKQIKSVVEIRFGRVGACVPPVASQAASGAAKRLPRRF